MNGCSCGCDAPSARATHAIAAALDDGDVDRALRLGLLDAEACPGCTADCRSTLLSARDARLAALAARERFRARNLRLERRAAERAARRAPPAQPAMGTDAPPLPPAAADALARALAKAGLKR